MHRNLTTQPPAPPAAVAGQQSLATVFEAQCRALAPQVAYTFLQGGKPADAAETLTYGQLADAAHGLAHRLQTLTRLGDRILLALPPGLDFVRLFWACMLCGRVAVPVPAPDPLRLRHAAPRLRAILEDARAELVLTSASLMEAAASVLESDTLTAARWMSVDQLMDIEPSVPSGSAPALSAPEPDSLAYLQYTSGSTAAPRGVRLSHANVLANVRALAGAVNVNADSRILCWLPHFHDYGLVGGILSPLVAGGAAFLMSPVSFLRRPLSWLDAMAALAITHSGAPESALAACLRALESKPLQGNLGRLVSLTCGAEPIRAATVEQVLKVFGNAGMRPHAFTPAYGLAETVLGVTISSIDRAPRIVSIDNAALRSNRVEFASDATASSSSSRRFVGCGRPVADTEVRIVDADVRRLCEPGEVGEIWVRSPSVGSGYWNNPEATEATFSAHLADGSGPWLRTGDLGFVDEGDLFITGRLKDLVIVHGENHYPQDLEWTAEHAHADLRVGHGAAFSVDDGDGESLVLALELERRSGDVDTDEVARAVRRAIAQAHALPVEAVVLLRSGALPRTSSGKIQRRQARDAWQAGQLDTVAVLLRDTGDSTDGDAGSAPSSGPPGRALHVMPRDATEQALWDIWSELLDTRAFGVHESFFELGGNSLTITQVASRIADRLDIELPLAVLFRHHTIAALADQVTAALEQRSADAANPDAIVLPALPPLVRVPRDRPLPVTLSQRRMWLVQQFDPSSSAYNVAVSLRLRGTLDAALLQRAADAMGERHEALRTRLVMGADEPMQVVEPALAVPIETVDLTGLPVAARAGQARALLAGWAAQPFDLTLAPLHRVKLLKLDAREHVLFWLMHHAVSDNWSVATLLREALSLYAAWREGRTPALADIPFGYADYAAWQRQAESKTAREVELVYWRERLRGLGPLELPTDFVRPQRASFQGGRVSASMPARLRETLRAFCARQAATPFVVLLAVFKLMLSRQAQVTDIAVGSPIANRHRIAAEYLVGTLVNTLVMRTSLAGDPSFDALVQRVRDTAVQAYAHQEAPFDEVVETLDGNHEGLVRVLFNVLNAPIGRLDFAGLDVEEFDFERTSAQFDLSIHVDTEFTHRVHLEYASDLYAPETARRLLENFLALLEQTLAAPSRPISSFPMMSAAQFAVMRGDWNATARPLPPLSEQVVHRWLASADIAAAAVASVDSADHRLSYGDLAARSNALARVLRARGIWRGRRVALSLPRSNGMLIAMLAVLKSGAAYVPLDPSYPADRLSYMAGDAALAAIVTLPLYAGPLEAAGVPVLDLDELLAADLSAASAAPLAADAELDARPDDAAYMIYTSGSTGRPKGVLVPHRAVVNFLASMARQPGLVASDKLLAVTTLSFDIAVLELMLPLAVGAQIVLADEMQVRDPSMLRGLIEQHGVTTMQATPSTWRMLLDVGWSGAPGFRGLIGGEPLPPLLAERLLACGIDLWNMYGPTETTVWSTCWSVQAPRNGISIGRPIDNTTVWVLDAAGQPCPAGVSGELCIGGDGVTLGYHERPELTADRFIPDPWPQAEAAGDAAHSAVLPPRLYRTGDRARWRHDGLLEHLGRLDHQVKVRGYRIELGEIESVLQDHPQIAEAVVVTRAEQEDDVRLVGYLVAQDPSREVKLDPTALREYLRARLPEHMLPQYLVELPAIPRLPNGKIDRSALPAPVAATNGGAGRAFTSPASDAEKTIARIWAGLLGIDAVGLADNFFDLGGHSLLAMRAVAAIKAELGVDVTPRRLVFESLEQVAQVDNVEVANPW